MSYLLADNEAKVLTVEENEEWEGPYEQIEELMQLKVKPNVKQELLLKMISPDLSTQEKERYVEMLFQFPDLFITSYEEIRGMKAEELCIDLKEGAKPVRQKIRRLGGE